MGSRQSVPVTHVPQTNKWAFRIDKRKEEERKKKRKKKKIDVIFVNRFIICRLVCIASMGEGREGFVGGGVGEEGRRPFSDGPWRHSVAALWGAGLGV